MANQSTETLDQIFTALGDTTRRQIIAQLSQGPASVSDLAAPHDMALPSFLKHLGKLEKAGLVSTTKQGRVRTATLHTDHLASAQTWIDQYKTAWTHRLDRLAQLAEDLERTSS